MLSKPKENNQEYKEIRGWEKERNGTSLSNNMVPEVASESVCLSRSMAVGQMSVCLSRYTVSGGWGARLSVCPSRKMVLNVLGSAAG